MLSWIDMCGKSAVLEDHVDVAPVRRHRRHVDAAEEDAPLVGLLEAADHAQARRLPAAARPEQREELALLDLERDRATASTLPNRLVTASRVIPFSLTPERV